MSSAMGFATPIPLTEHNSIMTVWVYASMPEVAVRLKLETHDNPEHAMELERTVKINNQWTPVIFDFNDARAGDYEHRVTQIWRDFGGWYYAAILIFMCWASLYHMIKYAYLLKLETNKAHDQAKEAKLKSAQALIEAKEAQLQMLRYQLNPHFLFNTLNSVYALIKLSEIDDAKSMVKKLSSFLRYSLESNPNELIKLSQEIQAIELYLGIEKVRFEDRLEFTHHITNEAASCLVPGMLLQPLVENSIKYAVANREEHGVIKLEAHVKDGWLEITVSDNGPDKDVKPDSIPTSTGIGIKNIKQRLKTLYNERYSFEKVSLSPSGLMVKIKIPEEHVLPDVRGENNLER